MAEGDNGRVEVRKTYKMYAGGEFIRSESGRSYEVDGMNVPRGSRKDVRDAVRLARAAFAGWSGRTAMNRGQILYRAAEMMDGRRSQFVELLGGGRAARREVERSIDTWVWYAGWTDKLAQVTGTVNPVAGPYFNFTLPEPTGVVGVIAPESPSLLGLVQRLAPVLAGGNTVVAIASESSPLAALTLGEVLATSDFPASVVNVLTGFRTELLKVLAAHMDVNALDVGGCTAEEAADAERAAAGNVKRVVRVAERDALSPFAVTAFMELKTVWHPIGV